MARKKILYITSEIFPYLEESYISKICRYLPQGIQEKENEIRTFMPKYGCINERKNLLHEVIRLSGQNIIIEDADHPLIIKVASLQSVKMQVYFIDSEDFFKRKQLFRDEKGEFFADNDSRVLFFAKGVIETVRKLGWIPDIIHCHGWISALVPIFIKTCYKDDPLFQDTKLIYSIYADQFKEKFSSSFGKKLKITGIPKEYLTLYKNPDFDNITKAAVKFSDAAIIAHPEVKKSLQNFVLTSDKPHLIHPEGDDYVDAYNDFYNEVLQQ
ncbi:MAG: glycogen/starch synthase [Bacteroidales bacterium]|nr:glycogen/starch synthase [Bacteroidales bacterium]